MAWTVKSATAGRPYYHPAPRDWSRIDRGTLDPRLLAKIPGGSGEERLFEESESGRKSAADWAALVASIRRKVDKSRPVIVRKNHDGRVFVDEGNHRIRAAIAAKRHSFPVEIQYYGGSEETGLVYDPETKTFSATGDVVPKSNLR